MLKSGLSSKLFLLSYIHPDSGYKYAQIIQNTNRVPNTSKIYPTLKDLNQAGYLKKKGNTYYPVPSKFFEDIKYYLIERNLNFSESELNHIKNIIFNHRIFILFSIEIFDLIASHEKLHKIDVCEFICNKIGEISTLFLHNKMQFSEFTKSTSTRTEYYKPLTAIDTELDQNVSNINELMKKKLVGRKSIKNKKIKSVDLLGQTMKSIILFSIIFSEIPNNTLEKLSNLWPQKQVFEMGINVSKIDPNQPLSFLLGNNKNLETYHK